MNITIVGFDKILNNFQHTCIIIDDTGHVYENDAEKSKLQFITVKCEMIPKNAFLRCSNLKVVEMDDCVRHIGKCAFGGCKSLIQVKFSKKMSVLEAGHFLIAVLFNHVLFQKNLHISISDIKVFTVATH